MTRCTLKGEKYMELTKENFYSLFHEAKNNVNYKRVDSGIKFHFDLSETDGENRCYFYEDYFKVQKYFMEKYNYYLTTQDIDQFYYYACRLDNEIVPIDDSIITGIYNFIENYAEGFELPVKEIDSYHDEKLSKIYVVFDKRSQNDDKSIEVLITLGSVVNDEAAVLLKYNVDENGSLQTHPKIEGDLTVFKLIKLCPELIDILSIYSIEDDFPLEKLIKDLHKIGFESFD